jgi:hypothetical protein
MWSNVMILPRMPLRTKQPYQIRDVLHWPASLMFASHDFGGLVLLFLIAMLHRRKQVSAHWLHQGLRAPWSVTVQARSGAGTRVSGGAI